MAEDIARDADGNPPARPGPSPVVLVVDDDPINRLLASEMLSALGFSPRLADSAEQAIAECSRQPPDLVLMDVEMPGMSGLDASRAIRRLQGSGGLPGFPIVGVTGHVRAEDEKACLSAGMDAHLCKPIDMRRLNAVLAGLLRPA